jgi:hypothetical protein
MQTAKAIAQQLLHSRWQSGVRQSGATFAAAIARKPSSQLQQLGQRRHQPVQLLRNPDPQAGELQQRGSNGSSVGAGCHRLQQRGGKRVDGVLECEGGQSGGGLKSDEAGDGVFAGEREVLGVGILAVGCRLDVG